jgi:hypothetical protein
MTEKNQGPPEPPVPEGTQPAGDRRKEFSAASTGKVALDAERKLLEARLTLVESDPNLTADQKEAAVRDLQRRLHSLREKSKES